MLSTESGTETSLPLFALKMSNPRVIIRIASVGRDYIVDILTNEKGRVLRMGDKVTIAAGGLVRRFDSSKDVNFATIGTVISDHVLVQDGWLFTHQKEIYASDENTEQTKSPL